MFTKKKKGKKNFLVSLFLVMFLLMQTAPAAAATRIGGLDRYATAAACALQGNSRGGMPPLSDWGVVATGENWPDALCSGGLAGALNNGMGAPLLLVRKDSIPASTLDVIQTMDITKVYIVGGTGVVSSKVVDQLKNNGVTTIIRIAGQDRYYTSAMVASEVVKLTGSRRKAFVASGQDFPDALSITPVALAEAAPILLVKSTSIPSPIAYELSSLKGYQYVFVLGGTAAVSSSVYNSIYNVTTRIYGSDRYSTAVAIRNYALSHGWLSTTFARAGVANFRSFPDALSGGHYSGLKGIPLLGVEANSVPVPTKNIFLYSGLPNENFIVFGGTGAVSASNYSTLLNYNSTKR